MRRGGTKSVGGETRCGRSRPYPNAMLIRVDPPALRNDLIETLQRANCKASPTGADEIEAASPSRILTTEQARREIGLYLAIWRARHVGARAELVD